MGEPSIDKGGQKGEKLLERAWDALLDAGVDGENARRLVAWMKEYILFHDRRHPQEMGMAEIQQYLGAQPFQNTVGRKTGDWILKYVRFHKLRHPEEMGGTRSRTIPDPSGGRSTGVGYAQAVGAYEQSLRCQPNNPEAHHDLGRVLYKLGDVDRAADHLEQAAGQCDLVHPWLSLATIIPGCPGASPVRILEVRQAFARRLTDQAGMGQAERRPAVGADNRLRVGYLSAHFHLPHT